MIDLVAGLAFAKERPVATKNETDSRTTTVEDVESSRGPSLGNICLGRTGECTRARCQLNSGVCNLTTHTCSAGLIGRACSFNSHCHCPGDETNGVFECQVNPSCCDSCPPVGCDNVECCTDVCNQDPYCCDTEWDDQCASEAWGMCHFPETNDDCEGARLITDVPPSAVESDSGRATEDADDPLFGCYLNNPGAQGLQTVWYKFVATGWLALLQTCNSNSPADDSLLAVFAVGDPSTPVTQCNSLIPIGCDDDSAFCSESGKNSIICVQGLIPGNIYYIMVASKIALPPGKGYRLHISSLCDAPMSNDYCPNAFPIIDGTTPFGLAYASMDPPVESCIPTMINDVWFNYTATCSGTLTVETCGQNAETSPDTNLAIYDGNVCPPVAGVPIACSADAGGNCGLGSKVEVDAVEGNTYKIRLADNAENRPAGNLKITCAQTDCPAGEFIFTDPPSGVLDAARPHVPDNSALPEGVKTFKATGPRDALPSCFSFCESTHTGNSIASIVENPLETYTITLMNPIAAGALTTVTYTDTHSLKSVGRFTSHPGNVGGDAMTTSTDVGNLVTILSAANVPFCGNYCADINRSNHITPADLLEEVDLMTNGGPFDPPPGGWDGSLNPSNNPACPLP